LTQKEYIGSDSIVHLPKLLVEYGAEKIFLVTGRGSYSTSGAKDCLDDILKGRMVCQFCDFSVNPKVEDVARGISVFETEQFDIVLAVGGGSVIDTAKLINFLSVHPEDFTNYKFKNKTSKGSVRPLIAVPTTAGSGSEATSFAVLYANKEKFSIDNELLLPTAAIVDPDLTMSLPGYITATTGMDALSQAIESYWSVKSNEESRKYASEAIKTIMTNLRTAVNNPAKSARTAMAEAANLAGKAINITRTTAPHAISYPLTSYFGIPHGQAVAITIAPLLAFNSKVTDEDVQDSRGADYVRETINQIVDLLGAANVSDAEDKIGRLINEIGLETKLSRLKVESSGDIEAIVQNGFNPGRVKNNPRILTRTVLRNILNALAC